MKKKVILFVGILLFFAGSISAQIRSIPKVVEETFTSQYKDATNVQYRDELVRVDVSFTLNDEKMMATYSNKGVWKETKKEWTFDQLSPEVKDGFQKSKYADREVEETMVIYLPGGSEQYRILAKKNDVDKRYLYFNTKGRLLRSSITL